MKKHILFSLAVVFLSVIGCSKPDNGGKDNPQPPAPSQEQITIPSTVDVTPVVPPEGGDAKITFTAASAWTASVISTKADSWVDVNPKSGNPGPAEIKITTTPNDTYVERNATIQIKCGSKTKDIVLTQKQVDNITVTADKVELGAEGGTFTIELKSNIDFSYEIDGDWIKYVSTKAYSDKSLTFSAEPNDGVQKREGNITVKGGGFSEKIKVYQSGEEPTLVISQNEYELEAEGGSIVVEVSSNVSVIMTIPDSAGWITENETKSVSTSTFHLDVVANETYEARSAEITFSNEESGLSEKITINQNGKTFVHVTSVTLDKNELTLTEDEKATLVATVAPEDVTDKSVEWSSDKPEVASVDENGEVTAKSAGTATITVTTKDGGKTATCIVTVASKFRPVTSVTLNQTSASLKAGETVTLTATVNPDDATDKTVTWTTSDATIATVDNGVVTAKKVGTATITAKAGDKTAICTITVAATPVTSVTLNQTSASLKAGETVTLTATVNPDDATDKTVTWATTDATVATVNNGVVTAKKVGTATITAKAGDKTATCAITVVATPVTSITLNKTTASLKAGETLALTATVNPDDATDKTVTWSTTDATVATVSNGVVTAKKVGTATITAKAGDKTATCEITVVATPVTSVTLNQTSASLKAGETVTLTATVSPDDATDKTVTWATTDATVATVDNGKVTAKKVGTATITAKAGDKTATCSITVVATPVTSVTLNQTSAQLKAGETVTLTATVSPDDATDKTVTWSTTDATVATVSNGVVTAKKVGTATLTAKAGDKTATCAITVVATPVTSVTLNQTSASLKAGETVTLTATVNPNDATDKTVTWSTTDATVATVSNGVVTAKKVGTATITAKAGDKTATCAITVVATPVTSVTLNQTSASLKAGETVTLTATVNPSDATDKTVTWTTTDATVATVNNGVVTAKKVGTATITAKAGDKTATCAITVVATPVTSVTLNQTSAQLKAGETVSLTATVNPSDATDKTVTWSTTDATVATVSNGVVTAKKVGTATITAKAGDKTATCAVTVEPILVTSVSLDKTSLKMIEGDSQTLVATVYPDNATNRKVTWTSSNSSIVKVDQNGKVTAIKAGTASVTVTTEDGGKTATCNITVDKKPNVEDPEEGDDWGWD